MPRTSYHRKPKTALGNRNYFINNPHSCRKSISPTKDIIESFGNKARSFRQILTIDPGVTNTGLYLERIWSNGTCEYVGSELFHPLSNKTNDYAEIIEGGTRLIEKYQELFESCHYILVESQLDINMPAVRLCQHYISSLCINLKNKGFLPLIIEFNPELKTKLLGAPPEIKTKPQRKAWCIEKAIEILQERGEEDIAEKIFLTRNKRGQGKNKKDDIADGICMVKAFGKIWSEEREWKKFLNTSS